jgi:hypothetical protein
MVEEAEAPETEDVSALTHELMGCGRQWSAALDFDRYITHWTTLGTSSVSGKEGAVGEFVAPGQVGDQEASAKRHVGEQQPRLLMVMTA